MNSLLVNRIDFKFSTFIDLNLKKKNVILNKNFILINYYKNLFKILDFLNLNKKFLSYLIIKNKKILNLVYYKKKIIKKKYYLYSVVFVIVKYF